MVGHFDCKDLLDGTLRHLAANDDRELDEADARIEADLAQNDRQRPAVLIARIYQGLAEARGRRIAAETKRILEGANLHDFEEIERFLSGHWEAQERALLQKMEQHLQPLFFRLGFFNMPIAGLQELLRRSLLSLDEQIGTEIKLVVEQLRSSQPIHLSLQAGQVFTANRALRLILEAANTKLDIIDNYFGPEVFDMLEVTKPTVHVRLLSERCDPRVTKPAYLAFKNQFGRVEYRVSPTNALHDRFIIIDDQRCITIGHSLKDLGKKMTEIHEIQLGTKAADFQTLWSQGVVV
jgi:flagellar motor switch/type III secretory pathway protein FliN